MDRIKELDLIVTGFSAEHLCNWLCSELNADYPVTYELADNKRLIVFAECVPPELGRPNFQVVVRGKLNDYDRGKEANIDTLAWLEIHTLSVSGERIHLRGNEFVYGDLLLGWIENVINRLGMISQVEEVSDDTKPVSAQGEHQSSESLQERMPYKGGERRKQGSPGLDEDELFYRLAKAQEAVELRKANPEMRWKEIALAIDWRYGITGAGLKKLQYARDRLKRMENGEYGDPEIVKLKIKQWTDKTDK